MASSSTRVRFDLIASAACALALLGPATAQAADTTTTPTFDARRAMPLFPGNSWRDGFYIEHSPVSDFGFQIRTTGVYGRNPLGITDEEMTKYAKIEIAPGVKVQMLKTAIQGLDSGEESAAPAKDGGKEKTESSKDDNK